MTQKTPYQCIRCNNKGIYKNTTKKPRCSKCGAMSLNAISAEEFAKKATATAETKKETKKPARAQEESAESTTQETPKPDSFDDWYG